MIPGIDDFISAWLISTIGFANTLSRIISGVVSDYKFINRLYLFSVALAICGLSTGLMAVSNYVEVLFALTIVFGLCVGKYYFPTVVTNVFLT